MITDKNRWRPNQCWVRFHKIFGDVFDIPVIEDPVLCYEAIQKADGTEKYIVFADTETSGLDAQTEQILQFSAIKYLLMGNALYLIGEIDQLIKNDKPIPAEVSAINHLTEDVLSNAPTQAGAYEIIREFLGENFVFIAYNTPFDLTLMEVLYQRNGDSFTPVATFDVMAMFIDLFSIYKCQQRKLSAVAKYLRLVTGNENFHNALDDIRMTVKVFTALVPKYAALPTPEKTNSYPVPQIYRHWFWQNPNRYAMKRIYFNTSHGKIFFEMLDRSFGTDGAYSLDRLNMEKFAASACRLLGVNGLEAMSHLRF